MARFIFFGALVTFVVCFPALCPESVFAMGSKSGLDQINMEGKQKEQTGQGPEKDRSTEKKEQEKSPGGNGEKSPPEKKPRLKYRDPYECGC